jgi:iron complex outermembrane receptor protein
MNINHINERQVKTNTLTSQQAQQTKTAEVINPFRDFAFDPRGNLSRLSLILLGAFVIAPDYSFAKSKSNSSSANLAAEVARLKKELGATQQENQQLKSALVNANNNAAASNAVDTSNQQAVAPETVAAAVEPVTEEKTVVEEPKNLTEVVVTSRRREEKLQDVPIPISVLSGKNLERDRTYDIQDLTKRAPSLTATTPNARRTGISLRGIGKSSGNDSMEPAVGVMIDDVFMGSVGMSYQDLTDIDRVEVLRGPQGTLMGKNTTMGLINYVTKTPSFKQQGLVEGEVGGNQQTGVLPGSFKGRASYSNAIVDDLLAFRASMYVNKQQGDIKDTNPQAQGITINERNRYGGRLQFLLTPTDKISFRMITDYAEGREYSNIKPAQVDPLTFANGTLRPITYTSRLARDYFGGYKPIIGTQAWNSNDSGQIKPLLTKNGGVSGKLDWDLGNVGTFTSILAYRENHFVAKNDSDETKFDVNVGGTKVDTKQYSGEFRLASKPFNWLDNQGGLFLMHVQTDSTSRTLYGQDAGAFYATDAQYKTLNTAANRTFLTSSLNNVYSTTLTTPKTDSVALFDQVNLHFTDKATLTLGNRETYESKSSDITKQATYGDGSFLKTTGNATADAIRLAQLQTAIPTSPRAYVGEWSTSWLASPNYKVNDNLMVYGSASGGQKSSPVEFNTSTGAFINIKPEKSLDGELGVKSLFLDKKLMFNLNLFYTHVKDYQATTSVVDNTTATGYRSQLGNIPSIDARGVELDSAYYPTSYLSFNFGGSYNHARYSNWNTATCPVEITTQAVCNNTGKQIVGAPEWTGIFGVDLHKPIDYGLTVHSWVNSVVRSSQNLDSLLSVYGKQSAYEVTDIGIGVFTGQKNKYELDLVGNNIFDTKYTTSVNSYSTTGPVGYDGLGSRRYVGLVLRANF